MALKMEIPEDFEPGKVTALKKDSKSDTMYWVYPDNSAGKKYGDASAEETYQWAKSLFKEFPLEDSSRLGLMVVRGFVIDICIEAAVFRHRNLLGGPELWETFEDWQRVNNFKKKDEKKNE